MSSLIKAARRGDLRAVQEAIRKQVNSNSKDRKGNTALILAAMYGHTDIVGELLSAGATVDMAGNLGWTALMYAAREGHRHILKKLLSSGATVDQKNKAGNTALIEAATYDCTDTVRELLSAGANIDMAGKDGVTALMEAACNGCEDMVRDLLSAGATVDLTNNSGNTALILARKSSLSNPETIMLLEKADSEAPSRLPQMTPQVPLRSLPVLSSVVTDREMYVEPELWQIQYDHDHAVYRNVKTKENKVSGYPLHQASTHPDVTFCDQPQEKEFSYIGGHMDYDNGLEITVPPQTVPLESTVGIKVQPCLAPKDVFVLPPGIQSASPSYLVTTDKGATLDGEITLSIDHHIEVTTSEEADSLLFLQADSSPKRSGSKSVYEYQEVPESRSEFTPGENKGKLATRWFSNKFFKVGFRAQLKKWFGGSTLSGASKPGDPPDVKSPPSDCNLYTVRLYQPPSQTTGDRIALVIISLCGGLYAKFLKDLDRVVIPRDYPEVSTRVADRTTLGSLRFEEVCATLCISSVHGWSVEPDREMIAKSEVDLPETENFKPEDLHDYPPRIVCRFFPEENVPKRTTCTISFTGLRPEVKVHIPLKAPLVKTNLDTTKLLEAADKLRSTVVKVKDTCLSPSVKSILSLMERMAAALLSSSIDDLVVHTDSIKAEIETVLRVCEKVVEECARETIKTSIMDSCSKMETRSHQLCQVAKVKLVYCQNQSEKTAALVDLVEIGTSLMRTVDCLLKDIQTLSDLSSNAVYNALVKSSDKIVRSLAQEPDELALRLLSVGLVTDTILEKTIELNETKREKAARLYSAVLGIVKHHPHKYSEFISILKQSYILHKDLLQELANSHDKVTETSVYETES